MTFGDRLDQFRLDVRDTNEAVVRASMFDLFTSIILTTPVDRGVLRNGWNISFGTPSNLLPTRGAPTGQATINRMELALNSTFDYQVPTTYFTNNLVYGPRIEFEGHSAQAPQGMVRVNTARWTQIVENNVRLLSD